MLFSSYTCPCLCSLSAYTGTGRRMQSKASFKTGGLCGMHTYKKVDAINDLASHCSYDSRVTAVKTIIIIINRIFTLKNNSREKQKSSCSFGSLHDPDWFIYRISGWDLFWGWHSFSFLFSFFLQNAFLYNYLCWKKCEPYLLEIQHHVIKCMVTSLMMSDRDELAGGSA